MRDFIAQRYNLLLCSTIIETGIDVPSANTIVMSRADKFGLAQLHQLRGRVGRSHHQAYAYLMVPDIEGLTKQASQRLEAIQQMEELGSGLLPGHARPGDPRRRRGAGRKPERQHAGDRLPAVQRDAGRGGALAQGGQGARPAEPAERHHRHQPACPALLPSDYCGDVHLRLSFYKKLASAKNTDQIDALLEEIVDRFGKLPPQAQTLIDVHRLRVIARPYGVVKVDAAPGVITSPSRRPTRRSTRCASSS
jgi:transcription-repair coupling factor (superfamily II helicase)